MDRGFEASQVLKGQSVHSVRSFRSFRDGPMRKGYFGHNSGSPTNSYFATATASVMTAIQARTARTMWEYSHWARIAFHSASLFSASADRSALWSPKNRTLA